MLKLIALFLALMSIFEFASADTQTGATLLENCTLAIRQSDGDRLRDLDIIKAVSCISYVSGFIDATGMVHSVRPQTQLVCMPEGGITNDQGIRILVKYLRSTPETLHESGRMSLLIALAKSFTCKK